MLASLTAAGGLDLASVIPGQASPRKNSANYLLASFAATPARNPGYPVQVLGWQSPKKLWIATRDASWLKVRESVVKVPALPSGFQRINLSSRLPLTLRQD